MMMMMTTMMMMMMMMVIIMLIRALMSQSHKHWQYLTVYVSQCISNTMPVVLPSGDVGDKSILLVELGQESGEMPEKKTMIGKQKDDDKDNTEKQLFKQH